ncbi:TorD/DmsD family molecular chaperone [Bacillus sp. V3-13]|uniref:TorD/DmsD family molecular chaperone n=1 Tax=Bacillus sp. V3-13 TaxID=2053728 RepID=UPI0015E12D9C|nr:molecular chaperone TorD family protein [Bacillus sp. V3-13]
MYPKNIQIISLLKERKFQYEFLHTIFDKPLSFEMLKTWKEQIFANQIESNEHLIPFLTELSSQETADIVLKEQKNFQELFFGPEHIPAPPWESVYRTRERILFGEPTLKMREKLRDFDLHYEEEHKEPEDHISVELEFMNYLIDKTMWSIDEENEKECSKALYYQFRLLDEHLMKWIEPFTADILLNTTSCLYKGSALFLRDFIQEDYEYMKEIKEVLGNE